MLEATEFREFLRYGWRFRGCGEFLESGPAGRWSGYTGPAGHGGHPRHLLAGRLLGQTSGLNQPPEVVERAERRDRSPAIRELQRQRRSNPWQRGQEAEAAAGHSRCVGLGAPTIHHIVINYERWGGWGDPAILHASTP